MENFLPKNLKKYKKLLAVYLVYECIQLVFYEL